MKFDYDVNKSAKNKLKHGISLEEAKKLWFVVAIEIEARTLNEPRFMRVGKIGNKFYSCIYTMRWPEIIRLISARRSRKNEEEIYYEHIKT